MGANVPLAHWGLADGACTLLVERLVDAHTAEAVVARQHVRVDHRVEADAALQLLPEVLEQTGVAREARRVQFRVETLKPPVHGTRLKKNSLVLRMYVQGSVVAQKHVPRIPKE